MNRALVILALVASVGTASADDAKPWAVGVPQDVQARANALFAEANQLFETQAHAPAIEKYQAALALWDHPLIRFNLAVTLVRLDRVLEAADELDRALRYDSKPFTPELYRQALDYRALINGRVTDLVVSCEQPDTRIQLDGKPWFTCPAQHKVRVLAGQHAIVAQRPGYLTISESVNAFGGTTVTKHIELVPLDRAIVLHYPIARWLPWTISAGGAAVAGVGLAVWFIGKDQLARFDNNLGTTCPMGCVLSTQPALASERSSALLKGKIGEGLMIGGGVTAVAGVITAIANRPHRVLPQLEVLPAPGGATASFGGTF